jgi:P-type conjugative transfer protein TrbJ
MKSPVCSPPPRCRAVGIAAGRAAHPAVVFDPSNFVQNTLTAVRTLEQINNQINQLQNEAQMLMNQARNLASLPFNVVNRCARPGDHRAPDRRGAGLAYDVTSMDASSRACTRAVRRHHQRRPDVPDAQERWKNTLNGLQTTMQMQAQVSQNLSEDESVLADLVGKSQSATGALQAMQAMNQLLALQAKQSIQAQQLQITQDRAASLELARQAAARSAPAKCGGASWARHAVHAAVRQLLQPLTEAAMRCASCAAAGRCGQQPAPGRCAGRRSGAAALRAQAARGAARRRRSLPAALLLRPGRAG